MAPLWPSIPGLGEILSDVNKESQPVQQDLLYPHRKQISGLFQEETWENHKTIASVPTTLFS